jgi:rubrerythrin
MLIEVMNMNLNDEPVGLSVWEQELYNVLREHVRSESQVLDRYENLADTASGHVRFLIELIAEDEARHHTLYEQWAETIKAMPFIAEPDDGVPDLKPERDPARLLAAIDDLLAFEKQDADQLKKLDKKLKDVRETTIWPLLVELMALDTRKHIRILEFLRDHAKRTARAR